MYLTYDGYVVAHGEREHRRVFREAFDCRPSIYVVHHINGHRTDNDPANLIALPGGLHTALHHGNLLGVGGVYKVCKMCGSVLPESEMALAGGVTSQGRRGVCRACDSERANRTKFERWLRTYGRESPEAERRRALIEEYRRRRAERITRRFERLAAGEVA